MVTSPSPKSLRAQGARLVRFAKLFTKNLASDSNVHRGRVRVARVCFVFQMSLFRTLTKEQLDVRIRTFGSGL